LIYDIWRLEQQASANWTCDTWTYLKRNLDLRAAASIKMERVKVREREKRVAKREKKREKKSRRKKGGVYIFISLLEKKAVI
jgi:hypothetical protein